VRLRAYGEYEVLGADDRPHDWVADSADPQDLPAFRDAADNDE